MIDRIVYMRTSGGVPPSYLRVRIEASGEVVAERHLDYPSPPTTETRRGRCSLEHIARLAYVLDGLDQTALRGPPPDSPNEWFEVSANGTTNVFSIVSLAMVLPGSETPRALTEIRAALAAIFDAIGGEP